MCDSEIFPVTVQYEIDDNFDIKTHNRKHVKILIDNNIFAVINSDRYNDVWSEPLFMIMRGYVSKREIDVVSDICQNVKLIMSKMYPVCVTGSELKTYIKTLSK